MTRSRSLYLSIALVLAACSGGAEEATTTTGSPSTTDASGPATTEQALTTTTMAAATTTTAAAVTTTIAGTLDADATVTEKTSAVIDALPDGWSGETEAVVTDVAGEDVVYEACLSPEDFDIDNLDDFTDAALSVRFEGPSATPPFPGPMGSIETRVFGNESDAAAAFDVFRRIWGTTEGLDCMTESVLSLIGDDIPAGELTLFTEPATVAGSQAGARFAMGIDVEGFQGGFYVEFQGARIGECTVVASFITFGEPLDREIADAIFAAAVNA